MASGAEKVTGPGVAADTGTVTVDVAAGVFEIPKGPLLGADQMPWQRSQQTWGNLELATTYFGGVANIPCVMIGAAAILAGCNFLQVMLGAIIGASVTSIMFSLNGLAGAKYGIPHTVALRAAFGNRGGAWLTSVVRASVGVIWFSIQCWLAGIALDGVLLIVAPPWGGLQVFPRLCVLWLFFYALQYVFIRSGYAGLRLIQVYGAPVIILSLVATIVWGRAIAGTWGPVFEAGSKYSVGAPINVWLMTAVVAVIAGWTTWVINVSDISRAARTYRTHVVWAFLGMWAGWMISLALGAGLLSMAEALGHGPKYIPQEWLGFFPNPIFAVVVLALVISLGITTNLVGNLVTAVTTLANIFPKRLDFTRAAGVAMLVSMVTFPWVILENPDTFMAYIIQYGAVLGAIAGIMIADLWVIRRGVLPLPDLYEINGRFKYWPGGINWVGVAAFVVSAAISWFNPTVSVILSIVLGFVLYLLFMYVAKGLLKEVKLAMPEDGGYPATEIEAGIMS